MTEAAATAQAEGKTAPQAGNKRGRGSKTTPNGKAPATKRTMSDEHKQSLKLGREQGRIVTNYLEALDAHRPKRGRRVSKEELEARLSALKAEIPNLTGKDRLRAIQDRIDLENRIEAAGEDTAHLVEELQKQFVGVAKEYAERNGFTAQAFREAGVPAAVLKEAGLTRKSA